MSKPQSELQEMGKRGRAWIAAEFAPEEVAARMREVYLWATGRTERPGHVHD